MRYRACGTLLLLVALVAGCATARAPRSAEEPGNLPPRTELTEVPFFPQRVHGCGPAALATALRWSGVGVLPEELVANVYSPARRGSLPMDMVSATRRRGRLAYPISTMADLMTEVAAGNPVIVLQDVGWWRPRWHFAVVVGYDRVRQEMILRSGRKRRDVLSRARFELTWARSDFWGLLVLPPKRLPATAREQTFLEAVTGLERARQWAPAARAYRAAHERWPASASALIGLGNSRYALGDLAGALGAFRAATQTDPMNPAAFNNLAHLLAEMGHREEALAAAGRAVTLGGPLEGVDRATRRSDGGLGR